MSYNSKIKKIRIALILSIIIAMLIPNGFSFAVDGNNQGNERATSNIDYEFDVHWANGISSDVKDYHYTDNSKSHIVFTPSQNDRKTAIISYNLKLKNDANTVLPAGAIKITVPAYIFKGWNDGTETNGELYRYIPHLKWQIPKAPATSTVSDFNYTENEDGTFTVSNFKPVSGNATLYFEQGFSFFPNLVKVNKDDKGVGDEETGSITVPVKPTISIDAKTPVKESKELKISLENKNKLTDISLKQANLDEYKGIYFDWQDQWGEKPSDSDDYFYVIWYADIQRSTQSLIPFKYEIKQEDDGVGGEIVGVKKDTYDGGKRGFVYKSYLDNYTDSSYANIAKDKKSVLTQDGLWGEFKKRDNPNDAFHTLYGVHRAYSAYNSARFSILKRYPKKIIEDEKKKGTDLSKDGFKLPNKMSLVDTLENGVVKKHEVVSADADIHVHNYSGKNNIWKYDSVNEYEGLSNQVAAQDFLLQGLDVKFNYRDHVKSTFSIHTTTSSSEAPTVEDGKTVVKPYTAEIEDGKLYHSTKFKNYNDSYSNELKNFTALKDGDATYKSVYFSLKEFDARKTDGGWQKIVNPSKEYEKFKPIEIFVRYIGETGYKKLGQVTFGKDGKQNYTSVDGKTEIKDVGAGNPILFPEKVAGLKYSHTSEFFESDLYAMPMLVLHPTNNLKSLITQDKDNAKTSNRDYTTLSSDAKLKVSTQGGKTVDSGTTSQLMRRSTKVLTPLRYSTYTEKEASNLVDDVKTGKQTSDVTLYHGNLMNLWDSGNKDFAYIDKYIPKKLAFYDLLPAGTYVEPNSIRVRAGHWHGPDAIDPSNYTVEYKENWEGSGQTMMIVTVTVPDYNRKFYERYPNHGTRVFVNYKLVNTYNNISDRGTSVINSIGVKNLTDDVEFHSNAKDSNIAKKSFYKNLIDENPEKWRLSQATMNYNPVTVKQAGVTKKAANDHDNEFKEKTNIFAGNKYAYKLAYTMASETRADQIVMYDILENGNGKENSEWQGKLDWIDLSAIKQKPAYGHDGETCAPEVYISKSAPASIKKDLDDKTMWKKVDADKVKDIGKIDGITAIAIDCRKTNKGNDFVLDRGMGLQADVHMISPDDKSIDGKKTINQTDVMARTFSGTAPATSQKATAYEASAKVIAKKTDVTLQKTSDPESGTTANPTTIENKEGDAIKYTLKIENKDTDLDVRNIKLEDIIPDGLTPDLEKILVTSESLKLDKTPITGLSQVGVAQSGSKLNFTVMSLPAGGTVSFEIPTKIKKKLIKTTLFDNTAKITSLENMERNIISETTHHKAIQQYKLKYNVQPDPVYGIPAGSVAPKDVSGIEYDTVKPLEQPLSTKETTDANGVKGIWKFTGWASKSNDIDGSILKHVAIKEDTTVYGKWEFNPTIDIKVKKSWLNDNEKLMPEDKIKNNKVEVELYRDGEKTGKTVELNKANNWSAEFEDLPVSATVGGKNFTYTVKEKGLSEKGEMTQNDLTYKGRVEGNQKDGFTVKNVLVNPEISVKGEKHWKDEDNQDGIRPENITVHLEANGQDTGKTDTVSKDTDWKYSFKGLSTYDENGDKIEYTVKEDEVKDYETKISDKKVDSEGNIEYDVNNIHKPFERSIVVNKNWVDDNNRKKLRPEEIKVNLIADGDKENPVKTETLKDDGQGNWSAEFKNLPVNKAGKPIDYTVLEEAVDNYTEVITGTMEDGFTITNTISGKISLGITKKWIGKVGKSISVVLNRDGEEFKTVEINSKMNWQYTFKNLPVYDETDGREYKYEVSEVKMDGYKTKMDKNSDNSYVITNTEIKKPIEKPNDPNTGDNSNLRMYLILGITAILLLSVVIARKKSTKK